MQLEEKPKKRRKRIDVHGEDPENHHDESNWLVSYADMMTLLFGFFVLMYSFSKLDKDKFKVVRKELTTYFGGKIVEDEVLKDMKNQIQNIFGQKNIDTDQFNVVSGEDKIVLEMSNELLFPSGSAELSGKSKPLISKLFRSILSKKVIKQVEVEGHTDAVPIKSFIYPSNWELSAARASRLVREFQKLGLKRKKMVVTGYGSSRPVVPNKDKKGKWIRQNLRKNRRVVINIDFGQDREAAQESIDKNLVKPEKFGEEARVEFEKKRIEKRRAASIKAKQKTGAGIDLTDEELGGIAKVKKKSKQPVDLLKNRLMKAQAKFKKANKKAIERKKQKAAEEKLLQKIKQLEDQTRKLEEES